MTLTPSIDDRTFPEKYGTAVLAGVVLLIAVILALGIYLFTGEVPAPAAPQEIKVTLVPDLPKPPPPPPPHPVPIKVNTPMVAVTTIDKTPPTTHTNAPHAPSPVKIDGPPSDNGLNNGNGPGNGNGDDSIGQGSGSVYGYYANQVGDQVRAALARDPRTRNARFHVKGRVFFDPTGRITRSNLSATSDDPAVDSAIADVLKGLQLPSPPQGMPPSVTMNLQANRAN